MNSDSSTSDSYVISAAELADYVVCPESWRLKHVKGAERRDAPRAHVGKQRRQEWVETQDLSHRLRRYAKLAYLLLVLLAITVFLWEQQRAGSAYFPSWAQLFDSEQPLFLRVSPLSSAADKKVFSEICLLLVILGVIIFTWDFFERRSRAMKKSSGLGEKTQLLALQGSTFLPSKELYSETLRLRSKPDAVVKETNFVIPVDIHPMAREIRDRHVVQLLAHLRLIEEEEGKSSPHGILVMGNKRRMVRVKNTVEKQRWLQTLIDEMHSILDGVPTVPTPSHMKCKGCDVQQICQFSAYRGG